MAHASRISIKPHPISGKILLFIISRQSIYKPSATSNIPIK